MEASSLRSLAEQSTDLPVEEQETQPVIAAAIGAPVKYTGSVRPVIVVRNLEKVYAHGVTALRNLSFQVRGSEFVAITGSPDAGKTTLLRVLGCLTYPTHGDYWLAGRVVSRVTTDELALVRNQAMGFVFQEPDLLPHISVLKNVALPLLYAGFSRAEQEWRARNALQFVGLGSHVQQKPVQLSRGQQRRVALARALVNRPTLLFADEPTGNLDMRSSLEMIAVLQALNQRGLTVVLVTHTPEIVLYAKRRLVLRDGSIVQDEAVIERRLAIKELAQYKRGEDGNAIKTSEGVPGEEQL